MGARSCEKSGLLCVMLAKCAACPPSCMSVVSAVTPDPTDLITVPFVVVAVAVGWRRAGPTA